MPYSLESNNKNNYDILQAIDLICNFLLESHNNFRKFDEKTRFETAKYGSICRSQK